MKIVLTRKHPAEKPFMLPFDRDTQDMMISAIRYAFGRRTYIVSETVDWAIPLLPYCKGKVLHILMKDFERYQSEISYSDDCDKRDWYRLYADIVGEHAKRAGHKKAAELRVQAVSIPFNRDAQDMLISAVRCAMQRRVNAARKTMDWAIPLLPHCENRVLKVLMDDFRFYKAQIVSSGDCDIEDWKRLKAAIVEERVRRADR